MSNLISMQRRRGLLPVLSILLICVPHMAAVAASAPTASVPATPRMALLPAGVSSVDIATDTVPGSNNIVDLVLGPPGVWAATGGGVSRYSLSEGTWETFTGANGLAGSEGPAVQVFGDQVWVSTSHSQVIQEQPVPWGDGLFMSTDGGLSWVNITPDSGQASGPFMLAYDIAAFHGNDTIVVAACFAGGGKKTRGLGGTRATIVPP